MDRSTVFTNLTAYMIGERLADWLSSESLEAVMDPQPAVGPR
jgi:hypothetical protein